MKQQPFRRIKKSNPILMCLLILWGLGLYAMIGAGVYLLFGDRIIRPTQSEVRADAEQAIKQLEAYKAEHGHYPASLEQAGIVRKQAHSQLCYGYPYPDCHGLKGCRAPNAPPLFWLSASCGVFQVEYVGPSESEIHYLGGGG
jgi:hypothetical protein